MQKVALFLVTVSFLLAANYGEMSTQELLAIVGYETKENEKKLKKELESRLKDMSDKEKAQYTKLYSKK